ncbi:MAG: hypothetical protein LLG09_02220 [Negativicutes bacterium]|nr:hypothetical protein [Negativicutes bacterium]
MENQFWDELTISTSSRIREYYKNENRAKKKASCFILKTIAEISAESQDISNHILDTAEQTNAAYIPVEISQGRKLLPAYAFLRVLQTQGTPPTAEQEKALDVYFREAGCLGFSKYDFIAAAGSDNPTRKQIENLVGIIDHSGGSFWQNFLQNIQARTEEEAALAELMNVFAAITMRFSVLGELNCGTATAICEDFLHAVKSQAEKCRSLPQFDIELLGEITYPEHYQRMRKIIATVSGNCFLDEKHLCSSFDYFGVGLLTTFFEKCNCLPADWPGLLDTVMKNCQIIIGLDGYHVAKEIDQPGTLRKQTYDYVNQWGENETNFWKLLILTARKTNRENMPADFFTECTNFLSELQSDLCEYYTNFACDSSIGKTYMAETMQKIRAYLTSIDN